MQVTVTSTLDSANNIPAKPGRKQLMLRNTGDNTVYYGWEADVSAAGATQGIPLEPDEFIAWGGKDLDLNSELKLICGAGETTTVNYSQKG